MILGLTLKKLRKHENSQVAECATKLYKKWRQHFKEQRDRPQIEVRFDNETNKLRKSGRKLLQSAFSPTNKVWRQHSQNVTEPIPVHPRTKTKSK